MCSPSVNRLQYFCHGNGHRDNRDIVFLIFADLGDGSGSNVSITSRNLLKAHVSKLFNLTGMGPGHKFTE